MCMPIPCIVFMNVLWGEVDELVWNFKSENKEHEINSSNFPLKTASETKMNFPNTVQWNCLLLRWTYKKIFFAILTTFSENQNNFPKKKPLSM